jgi:predicted metalloprotease with PDZ domain
VLTTLSPAVPLPDTNASADAPDYYALADSQILMGPDLQVRRIEGKIPLIMALYSEAPSAENSNARSNFDDEAAYARQALDAVQAYFGDTPIKQYTAQLELLNPVAGHDYNFSQEHIDSGTFSFATDWRSSVPSLERKALILGNYAHHIAHSWIPKRAYGVGYRPFTWELTPVIDTIWFNEGFGRYASIAALAAQLPAADAEKFRAAELAWMREIVDQAPPLISRMSLETLSREASFLYAVDFRLGKNIFSRGALMAAEMDDRIRAKTNGQKSLRDALRALLAWSDKNRRAFQVEEMLRIFQDSTNVDLRDILSRWQQPLAN